MNNPYSNLVGKWVRGSFHGHCSENSACSSVALADSVKQYADLGVGFVTLTDHDTVTDLTAMRQAYEGLVFLEGFEYSSRENVLFAGPTMGPLYELSLEEALARAGDLLTVVCHPRPHASGRDYWTRQMLEDLGTWPDGIEVYNGHYGIESAIANGRWPLYSDFWDELLSAGHRPWGYANDDFHDPEDFDNAFNMVFVEDNTPEGVIHAAKAGRSYASTGVLLDELTIDGQQINVSVSAPCTGRFIGPGGVVLGAGQGTAFSYQAGAEDYVRFEGDGDKGRIFLQPLFRN